MMDLEMFLLSIGVTQTDFTWGFDFWRNERLISVNFLNLEFDKSFHFLHVLVNR